MGKTHRSDGGGNKAARVAQKEQAALDKQRAEQAREDDEADSRWSQGAKRGGKKEEQAAKRADQLAQKAKRDAILAQEEEETPGRREPRKTKQAVKKSNKGLNLSQLDDDGDNSDAEESKKLTTVNASGIDNALDAFGLDDDTGNASGNKVEKHPERRFPAAYARFEERRLEEMKEDGSGDGLRMNQRKAQIRKEFERHPDNPFNQTTATYNATKDELREIRAGEAAAIESRLAANDDE